MHFKDWLFLEDFAQASGTNPAIEPFYPTNADDYAFANNEPVDHSWLQWKWFQERKDGRQFYNIDIDEFEKRDYTYLHSRSMPGDKAWENRADSGRGDLEVLKIDDLELLKTGKNSKDTGVVAVRRLVQVTLPLHQMFGDNPSGKWPDAASDKRWDGFSEEVVPYMPIGPEPNPYINQGMGVRSKFVGPDDTGEPAQPKHIKTADFGLDGFRKWRQKRQLAQQQQGLGSVVKP